MNFILRNDEIYAAMITAVAMLPVDNDKPVEIVIRQYKKKRSLDQNALLHAWCSTIADKLTERSHELFEPDYIKTVIKRRFGLIDTREDPVTGVIASFLVSTTNYSTEEFMEMLIKTELWCQDIDIDLSHKGCKAYEDYREARL